MCENFFKKSIYAKQKDPQIRDFYQRNNNPKLKMIQIYFLAILNKKLHLAGIYELKNKTKRLLVVEYRWQKIFDKKAISPVGNLPSRKKIRFLADWDFSPFMCEIYYVRTGVKKIIQIFCHKYSKSLLLCWTKKYCKYCLWLQPFFCVHVNIMKIWIDDVFLEGTNFCTKFDPLNSFFKRRASYHFKG